MIIYNRNWTLLIILMDGSPCTCYHLSFCLISEAIFGSGELLLIDGRMITEHRRGPGVLRIDPPGERPTIHTPIPKHTLSHNEWLSTSTTMNTSLQHLGGN